MNKNTWNSLSPDLQKIVTDVTNEMMPDTLCRAVSGEMEQGISITKELGHEIIDVSPEERARWIEASRPAWETWVKNMETKGLPGREVLNEALRLVEEYSK